MRQQKKLIRSSVFCGHTAAASTLQVPARQPTLQRHSIFSNSTSQRGSSVIHNFCRFRLSARNSLHPSGIDCSLSLNWVCHSHVSSVARAPVATRKEEPGTTACLRAPATRCTPAHFFWRVFLSAAVKQTGAAIGAQVLAGSTAFQRRNRVATVAFCP